MATHWFRIRYLKTGSERRVHISADARTDDDAIRMAHPLADLVEFEGGSDIEVGIVGTNNREVGVVSDRLTDDDRHFLERQHRIGAGYQPDSAAHAVDLGAAD